MDGEYHLREIRTVYVRRVADYDSESDALAMIKEDQKVFEEDNPDYTYIVVKKTNKRMEDRKCQKNEKN